MSIPVEIIEANSEFLRNSRAEISALLPSIWEKLNPVFKLRETSESDTWVTYNSGFIIFSSKLVFESDNYQLFDSLMSLRSALSVLGDAEFDLSGCDIPLFDGRVRVSVYKDIPQVVVRFYLILPSEEGEKLDEQLTSNAYFSFIQREGMLEAKGTAKVTTKIEQKVEVEFDSLYKDL